MVNDNCIVVFDSNKATSFCVFNLSTKKGFNIVKRAVVGSEENELDNWAEVLSITYKNGLIGSHTKIKKEWIEYVESY